MLIKFTYRNHKGAEFHFGEGCVLANRHDLYNYEWAAAMVGNRVGKLERSSAPRSVPLIFVSDSAAAVDEALDALVDLAEVDTAAKQSGAILINGYRLRCYITAVEHSEWLPDGGYCEVTLTVQPDGGVWMRELPAKAFNSPSSSVVLEGEDEFLQPLKKHANPTSQKTDYESFIYGVQTQSGQVLSQDNYSYEYAESNERNKIEIESECKMRLYIYGPYSLIDGLSVTIGGYEYKLGGADCTITLNENEILILDQERQTLEKENANGVRTNAFGAWLDTTKDILRPIPPGTHDIVWSGFSFYLTLIEERSCPRWL